MQVADTYLISIPNWSKFNPRSDRANYTWFRLQNDFFQDQAVFSLSGEQQRLFLFIACEVSKKNSAEVSLHLTYITALLRTDAAQVVEALNALEIAGLVKVKADGVKPAKSRRKAGSLPSSLPATNVRDERNETNVTRRNERDETRQGFPGVPPEVSLNPNRLVELWNSECGTLPKASRLSEARIQKAKTQIQKYPDEDHWSQTAGKLRTSSFCTGQWKPGFDDFLNETKRLRALEGNYDDKPKIAANGPPSYAQRRQANNLALLEKVEAGQI